MSPPARILSAVLVAALGVALVGCGDDDGGGSAFCERFQAGAEPGETEVETLDRLIDVAPPGVVQNLAILRNDAAERTGDGPAPEGFDHEAFAPGTDSEVRLRVFTFVATECGGGAGGTGG